ncbi:MAG: hypothetical protein ACD_5C00114G0004 [uncultured bacterium]|nr:MAG: hypothetical protein ACD_5C00114G0004 [uncultured bacterium]
MKELPKIYEPQKTENEIYSRWEKSGFFNPDNLDGDPYSIIMPPPNVTGVLHLGHALENSLMDTMARFQRMRGKKVLLLPGTDHAAVATQAKVEKVLMSQGIEHPREELGREKLLEEIKKFAENSKSTILKQVRRMGTSCDWSRLAYTFDEKRSLAVNTVFEKMYHDGLIYRGYRVVNWSIKGQSTLSDDELVYIERSAKLYTFKYSKDFPITIATTRPETKLGDTAVAINPNDERYKKYIGKTFHVEIGAAEPLEIKIITDENVDSNFGTGALGVTPAHSTIDFEMYEKQKATQSPIGLIQVIDSNGHMTKEAGKNYEGLTVLEAREKFVSYLKENGLLEKEEEITQNVGTSDRFGDVAEALPMTQWFIDVNKIIPSKGKSLKQLMHDAVAVGHNNDPKQKIAIMPERFEKIYFSWIENLRDWCISRQIWWGHRIPVWYRGEEVYCGITSPEGEGWRQDSDTLDTWFSSGLWTFSTLGWPENSKDLQTFHSTNWMQMGYEILFFWMARMILMTTYTLDTIPFKDVYIHGILRDEKGQKFSKSLGNTLDPIDVINDYGCDALRLSLLIGVSPGSDSKFYIEKIESCRNFTNKLWNISRYIISSQTEEKIKTINGSKLTIADKWILSSLISLGSEITSDIENYQFSQAGEKLKDFTWNEFADWYIEISKFENNKQEKQWILQYVLENLLKMWHPFMPFVTEAIWSEFEKEKMLIIESWPSFELSDSLKKEGGDSNKAGFNLIREIITSIRNGRLENNIDPKKKIRLIIDVKEQETIFGLPTAELLKDQSIIIKSLRTGVEDLTIISSGEKIENSIQRTVGGINIYIPLEGLIDTEKEKQRIQKEIKNIEGFVAGLSGRLNNESFVSKAPKQVIEQQKETLAKKQIELEELKKQFASLIK